MSLPPSADSVAVHVASFEKELAAATSARDAQLVRDRYLGRKHSVVASWMQTIGAASPEEKKNIGRYANDLKQAIEQRWQSYTEQAHSTARPAGAVDVTLPGRTHLVGHRHPLTIVRDQLEPLAGCTQRLITESNVSDETVREYFALTRTSSELLETLAARRGEFHAIIAGPYASGVFTRHGFTMVSR